MKHFATAIKGILIPVLLMVSLNALAQSHGSIKGTVTDASTGEPIFETIVILYQDTTQIGIASTDFDGNYNFPDIDSGTYALEFRESLVYSNHQTHGIVKTAERDVVVDCELRAKSNTIQEIEIVWEAPLVDEGRTSTSTSMSMMRSPTRRNEATARVTTNAAASSAVHLETRGTRANANVVYLDGVRGNSSDPTNSEEYNSVESNPFLSPADQPQSTFGMDVDQASYYNVKRMIENNYTIPPDAVRVEEFINSFSYDATPPEEGEVFGVTSELSNCAWNNEHQILRLTLHTEQVEYEDLPPSSYVFLVDVSGSMNTVNKLPLVKETLRILTRKLRAEDRVAIVTYAGLVQLLLPSTAGDHKEDILNAIDRLESAGSTNGAGGIHMAYREASKNFIEGGNNRVVLCTDGDFNVGVSSQDELIRIIEEKKKTGVFLSVIGYGEANYREGTMEQMANKGNGNMNYVQNRYDASRIMQREFISTLFTVAKDAKIQVEFNPNVVQEYRLLGYENRLMAARDFENDSIDGGEVGMGHQVTVLYEIIPGSAESEAGLRYQRQTSVSSTEEEIAYLSIRYKTPEGDSSEEFNHVIDNHVVEEPSSDQRFSMAVASFAGLLKLDSHIDSDLEDVILAAQNAKGEDPEGLKSDFIQLAQLYRDLTASR